MLASVRTWGVRFVIAGETFTIPARPASDWIDVIVSGGVSDLLDDDDVERLTDLAAERDISDEFERVFTDVIGETSGRDWHVGVRLVGFLMQDDLRGEVLAQIDPAIRPLAAVLDVVYATIVRFKTAEQRSELDAILYAPPDSALGESNPRERARQMRERSKQMLEKKLEEELGTATADESNAATVAEPVEAIDTPSSGTPSTST